MFESNYNFNVSNIPINHAYQYTKMIFLKKKILKLSYIQVIELLYKYIVMFIIINDIWYKISAYSTNLIQYLNILFNL